MKFSEFWRLLVKFGEGLLGWDVVFAGVDKVTKNTDENKWTDEYRVEHAPENHAADERTDEGKGIDV